ncbi:MAG: FKBP-type peptidyl-prolyl cis-trans isomerase [Spirosomaceae bacterium]|nr:FKBP-type peptidyl-prolyl cis-trans isomerase [Spirosomataceae bacterium]
MKKSAILIAGIMMTMFACEQTEELFEDRKTRENRADIRQFVTANRIPADSLRSGLYFWIQNANPNAQKPQIGDEVLFRYVARRLDGVVVDSSQAGINDIFIRSFNSRDLQGVMNYRFNPVPSFEELLSPPQERVREGDKVSLFVPWSLRNTTASSASLLAPLYIPIRYDLEILRVRTEEEQMDDYVKTRGILNMERDATTGLRFLRTKSYPDSTQIKANDEVKVTYVGRRVRDNVQFDSGTLDVGVVDPNGNARGSVVKGFNDGIAKLRFGEKAIVIFPSALGYGLQGSGSKIPAYSPLYFEIEVKKK